MPSWDWYRPARPCSLGPEQPPGRLSPAFTPLPVVALDPPWSPHFPAWRGPGATLFPAATQCQERATPTPPTAVREHLLRVGTAQHTAVTGRREDENPALTSGGADHDLTKQDACGVTQ